MSKVAQQNNVSHQCISTHINSLEKKLGVKLFSRSPHLTLTQEGQILFEGLSDLKFKEEKLISRVKTLSTNNNLKLRLGVPSSYYNMIVPEILTSFKLQYPNVNLVIEGDYSSYLEQAALDKTLDFFIGTGVAVSSRMKTITLLQEKLYFVASQSKFNNDISVEQNLNDMPLILPPAPSRLRNTIEQFANDHQCILNIISESNHLDMFCDLCSNNEWGCIISEMFVKQYCKTHKCHSLAFTQLHEINKEEGNIYIAYLQRPLTFVEHSLIAVIKDFFIRWRRL